MSKTKVIYKDIAPGAAADATVTATGGSGSLSQIPFGKETGKIITLERSRWLLDGSYDDYYSDSKVGFWSTAVSGDDGTFETKPTITLTFSQQYSSMGINLTFDEATGEYCSSVSIQWWQGDVLRISRTFAPNAVNFFCEQRVLSYDKIIVTLNKTVVPHRRAKLSKILMGVQRTFGMNEIRSAAIVNQMNESAVELPISTFNWTLDSIKEVDYLFQLKQPVEVYNDDNLIGVYYINNSSRSSSRVYEIECQDALGVLDYTPFDGATYLDGISAKELLTSLAKPFEIAYNEDVEDTTLTGLIAAGTNRSAIQQVIFAWGVCLATDGSNKIRVFKQPTNPTLIPKDRTFVGASVKTSAVVTRVKVLGHSFEEAANGTVVIGDKKYSDTTTAYIVDNPDVTASDRENVKEVQNATLVSADNGQDVADRLYKYYSLRDTNNATVVYAGEKLGDCVSIYTPWGLLTTGNLHKMEITLSNTVVYKSEVTGAWKIEPYYYFSGDLHCGEV